LLGAFIVVTSWKCWSSKKHKPRFVIEKGAPGEVKRISRLGSAATPRGSVRAGHEITA
jgi:hypothetical protein